MDSFRDDTYKRERRFRTRLIASVVVAIFVFAIVKVTFQLHFRWDDQIFVGLVFLASGIAYHRFFNGVRCPSCRRGVGNLFMANRDGARCPHCGADWTQPTGTT